MISGVLKDVWKQKSIVELKREDLDEYLEGREGWKELLIVFTETEDMITTL